LRPLMFIPKKSGATSPRGHHYFSHKADPIPLLGNTKRVQDFVRHTAAELEPIDPGSEMLQS
jgi:hypothetical protein